MSDLPTAAPAVVLTRDGGTTLDISNLRPDWVVLFFYPRDDTSGCTKEALAFTALRADFTALGAQVVGISKDSVASHDKFVAKYQLAIPLLSDENDTVCETFCVWKEMSMYGKTYMGIERSTFLIDWDGQIAKEWRKVKVPGHAEAVLQTLKDK